MKKAVLLINLGTPAAPTEQAIKQFLAKFLADRHVINLPRIIWLPILHGFILPFRPKKIQKNYELIWTEHGSPLEYFLRIQAQQLQEKLPDCQVSYAMSYSQPFISEQIEQLIAAGANDITFIPMFPQYSTTTTASIEDEIAKLLPTKKSLPTVHLISSFYNHPLYIACLVEAIQDKLTAESYDLLLFSYHGIPCSVIEAGDPYQDQCETTTALVMAQLPAIPHAHTYQSKFGPSEWLKPATIDYISNLPAQGIKKVLILTPGFVADCLETIEEINETNRKCFLTNGGEIFDYISPFNESSEFTNLLKDLVRKTEHSETSDD